MPKIEPHPSLVTVSVRLPYAFVGRFYNAAAAVRLPPETIVRRALDRWLDEHDATHASAPVGGDER